MFRTLLSIASLALVTLACGEPQYKNERTPGSPESGKVFSYSFNGAEGCQTAQKTFSNQNDLCRALVKESFNNNCAQAERHQRYQSECKQFGTLEEAIRKEQENAAAQAASPFPGIANTPADQAALAKKKSSMSGTPR